MKFAFKLPTGIQICERTVKPAFTFNIEGVDFFAFDKNIYFSKGKVSTKNVELTNYVALYFSLFAQFDGHLFHLCNFTNKTEEDCKDFIKNNIAQIHAWEKEYSEALGNLTEYNIKLEKEHKEQRAENEKQREKRKQEAEQRDQERKNAILCESIKAESDYLDGKMISWDHFEDICARYNVKLPIRTLGAARKRVTALSKNRHVRFSGSKSPSFISPYISKLNKELEA